MPHDRPPAPAAPAAGASLAPPPSTSDVDPALLAALAAAERLRHERDLLAGQLREVFEQSPVSTVVYDAAGRPLTVNPAFERLWGVRLADAPPDYSVLGDPQLEAAGVMPLLRRAFGLDGAHGDGGAGEPVTLRTPTPCATRPGRSSGSCSSTRT